jgi:hypothetical protein
MKTNKKNKAKLIKELATQFEEDFKKTLAVTVLPNGNVVYKNYTIALDQQGNWAITTPSILDPIGTFYLKTSALMAAKSYDKNDLNRMFEIVQLDRDYRNNHIDSLIFSNNIKKARDFNRYMILLNKLEYSQERTEHFKEQISKMFKYSFA